MRLTDTAEIGGLRLKSMADLLRGNTRFGRLVAVGEAAPIMSGGRLRRRAACRCDCGAETAAHPDSLRSGRSTSCGCFHSERQTEVARRVGRANARHGESGGKSAEYRAWLAMNGRCTSPTHEAYANYGGRGITVCARWRDSFEAFLADMGRRPTVGHSLDREDNNKGYEPGNCRWATSSEQNSNRRKFTIRRKTKGGRVHDRPGQPDA